MISLTKSEFERFEPLNGLVLVAVEDITHKTVKGGLLTTSNDSISKAQHAVKSGLVVKAPKGNVIGSFDHYQDIEVQIGDIVTFDYAVGLNISRVLAGMSADDSKLVVCEDQKFFLVPYGWLYLRQRSGVIVALNGFIVGKKVLNDTLGDKYKKDLIEVVYDTIKAERKGSQYYPRIGEIIATSYTPVPLEHENLTDDQLFRVNPTAIYATI